MVIVLTPDLEDKRVDEILERISRWVSEAGGSISKIEKWGKRKLAYPIKHLLEGNYIFTLFKMNPLKVKEFDTHLKLSSEIIRYLIVKTEK